MGENAKREQIRRWVVEIANVAVAMNDKVMKDRLFALEPYWRMKNPESYNIAKVYDDLKRYVNDLAVEFAAVIVELRKNGVENIEDIQRTEQLLEKLVR